VVGHHGDGVVELHDLTHAFDCLGGRIVDALDATPNTGDCAKVAFHARGRTSMP